MVTLTRCPHFLETSPQKPLGQSKSNFIWSFYAIGERKFAQMVLVTWPRWPPCPYMVKTLKNLLLRNQKADDLETWYASSGAWVLPGLLKWWPWVDLDLFYSKVKYGPLCFYMEDGKTMDFQKLLQSMICNLISNRWLKWQEVSVDIKTLSPGAVCPLSLLYTWHSIKSWKNLYKIRLQRDFFETCNKWVKR